LFVVAVGGLKFEGRNSEEMTHASPLATQGRAHVSFGYAGQDPGKTVNCEPATVNGYRV